MTRTEAKIKLTNLTIQIETEMREPVTSERARVIAKLITERAGIIADMRKAKLDALSGALFVDEFKSPPVVQDAVSQVLKGNIEKLDTEMRELMGEHGALVHQAARA
jgi:hypothetical protein